MAADNFSSSDHSPLGSLRCLLEAPELELRLQEEIARAGRQGTALSCLLVSVRDTDGPAREHDRQLDDEALAYLATALSRQLRRFDRVGRTAGGELVVVLPGADERRGEIVARRALGRLHSIKLEIAGERRPLPISVGIAGWQEGLTAERLLLAARLAAQGRLPS